MPPWMYTAALPCSCPPPPNCVGGAHRVVEAPSGVWPAGEAWLVLHCLAMLDAPLTLPMLRVAFGWDQPPLCRRLRLADPLRKPLHARLKTGPRDGSVGCVVFTGVHTMLCASGALGGTRRTGFSEPGTCDLRD